MYRKAEWPAALPAECAVGAAAGSVTSPGVGWGALWVRGPLVELSRPGYLLFPPAPCLCFADAARGPRRLMRAGLALILVGHVNLLVGAVLHGTVLRHVANPGGGITPEYTTANVVSVGSGLLVSRRAGRGGPAGRVGIPRSPPSSLSPQSVAAGLVALLASKNLFLAPLVRLSGRGGVGGCSYPVCTQVPL